jgi:ADP-heptose:LPS heptosyltransferase
MGRLGPFQNILVIRLRAYGDTLLTTPLLRGLKTAYPAARLSVVMEPAMGAVLSGLPYVDEVIPFDRLGFKARGWLGEFLATLGFFRSLRKKKFDLVLDVLGTPRTAAMAYFSGAATRVGFAFGIRRLAYNVVRVPAKGARYIADFSADLLRSLGHEPDSLALDFRVPEKARQEAGKYLDSIGSASGRGVILVSPAGGWALKRYPTDLLRRAVALIQAETRLPVVLVWGPGEEELVRETVLGLKPEPQVAPPTDLALLGALLERAALLVANDGATKHLAVALGTPSLTLFGPTSDVAWHPPADPRHVSLKLDLPCMPCESHTCRLGTHECFRALDPERVASAALEMLSKLPPDEGPHP